MSDPIQTLIQMSLASEPQMEYEVREDGEWVKAESGKEILGSGCLRYIKDGFAKTASPGEWREGNDHRMDEAAECLE